MSTEKCLLLIDLDSTVVDWGGRMREDFSKKFPSRQLADPCTTFYTEDCNPPEWRSDIEQVSRTKGFYLGMNPIPGAIEALKDIETNCLDYIEPFLCSSPDIDYEEFLCHTEKVQWVHTHLGPFWTRRLILTKDKTLVRGHILIDDRPEVVGVMAPTWNQLHYSQPWNEHKRGVPGNPEVDLGFTWDAWESLRDDVLKPNFSKPLIIQPSSSIILPS